MKFYRLRDDINFPERWFLGDIQGADNWDLVWGKVASAPPEGFTVEIHQPGEPMDFTFTETYGVPVVSHRLREALAPLAGVRFLPARLEGRPASVRFHLMIVENTVAAVDEERSAFQKFLPNDPVRPDKAGQYKAFIKLVIDGAKAAGRPVFRLEGARTFVVVSEEAKQIFDAQPFTGIDLREA